MSKKIETVSHLKPYHGWNIDKVSVSVEYENGYMSIPDVTYWVYAPGIEDCQNIVYSLESAKSFIRQHDWSCTYHLYWVSYETGANRFPHIVVVSALSATDAVKLVKAPYNRGEKVPFPFSAKAHRVPNGMTEERATWLAKECKYSWQRGITPWDLCK